MFHYLRLRADQQQKTTNNRFQQHSAELSLRERERMVASTMLFFFRKRNHGHRPPSPPAGPPMPLCFSFQVDPCLMASPCSSSLAFKQSPQGIPALATGIKKRRHGEEETYYVPVSTAEVNGFLGCLVQPPPPIAWRICTWPTPHQGGLH